MIVRKQLWYGWIVPALAVLMFILGACSEKALNDKWLNNSILEGRSRALVFFIELSKKAYDTGDDDLMRRFLSDAYEKRHSISRGADSEDFSYFWTEWATDIEALEKYMQDRVR
ncbi:MAG: hypothetical protein E7049_02620 [Lentisphaerae bacterium]|nr:hypothetical protein [Lentisphaerota bacterium]